MARPRRRLLHLILLTAWLGAAALLGRHLLAMGVKPGPLVGRLLKVSYEKQLDGQVRTVEEAIEEARRSALTVQQGDQAGEPADD